MFALLSVFAGDFASKAAVVLTNIYLIQVMTVSDYAVFSLLFAITQFSYQAICGVVERLYISEYDTFSRQPAIVAMFLGALPAVGALLYYLSIGEIWIWFAIVICVSCLSAFQIQRIKLQKEEKYRAFAAMDVFRNSVTLVLIVGASNIPVLADKLAPASIYVISIGALVGLTASTIMVPPSLHHSPGTSRTIALLWERRSLVLFCLLSALVPYLPIFLAGMFADERTVASYGVAQRYQAILSMLVLATNVYLLPKVSNAKSISASSQQVKAFNRRIPAIVAVCFLYIAAVWYAMPFLNGREYEPARWLFIVLSMASVASFLSTPYASLLLKGRRYFFMFGSVVLGIFVTIAVSLALVSRSATFLSYAFGSLAGYVVISVLFIALGVRITANAHPSHKL